MYHHQKTTHTFSLLLLCCCHFVVVDVQLPINKYRIIEMMFQILILKNIKKRDKCMYIDINKYNIQKYR